MLKKNITIPKTARYFQSGPITDATKNIWIVCHGYGQLANYFAEHFTVLDANENVIIAPEGLHRFYWQGFSGKVVASWMTKEDRLDDIADNERFMDAVHTEVLKEIGDRTLKVNVLGFSQGVATVCRWLNKSSIKINNLILWSGSIPDDLDLSSTVFTKQNVMYVIGDADEFFDAKQRDSIRFFLEKHIPAHTFLLFKGKHEIEANTLLKLASLLK